MIEIDQTRMGLYQILKDRDVKFGAEVGVQYGINAIGMLETIPDLRLYLIDPWCYDNRQRTGLEQKDIAMKNLDPYSDRVAIYQHRSWNAAHLILDRSLDFVYIDGDHYYEAVMLDILTWNRKVKVGGLLCGHDYVLTHKHGVKSAVDSYVENHNIELRVVGPNWYWEIS